MNKKGRKEGEEGEEEKGLVWKLPQLKSKQLGKLGPAFGIGAGCGLGFGIGLLGGAGFGPGIPGLQVGVGFGAGCGVGLGFGYGVGRGIALDENRRYSNVGHLSHRPLNFSTQSEVSMGFATALWFRDAILEVAKLSRDQNVFRSFREGNKVYVIQKQRNDRGNFVTVTVLGDSKGRGGVIILEGRESWGWRGISMEVDGLLRSKAFEHQSANHHRRQTAGNSTATGNLRKELYTFKEAVTQGNDIPNISPNPGGDKITEEVMAKNEVFLNLKVKLIWGTDGKWQAAWAGLTDSGPSGISGPLLQNPIHDPKSGPTQDINPGPKHSLKPGPTHTSRSQVWRPIGSNPNNMSNIANKGDKTGSGVVEPRFPEVTVSNRFSFFQVGESSGTRETADLASPPVADPEDSDPLTGMTENRAVTLAPAVTIAHPPAGVTENRAVTLALAVTIAHPPAGEDIARTWGSSSNWMLELRDGRRITIPLSLIRSMPSHDGEDEHEIPLTVAPIYCGDGGSTVERADLSAMGRFYEETPLEVAPLAMAGSAGEGLEIGGDLKVGIDRKIPSSPTQVLEQFQEFGRELGVSFEGFEEELLILLKAIEDRRNSHSGPGGDRKKMQKSGGKGSRELKNLISTINYNAGGSKNRGSSRERAFVWGVHHLDWVYLGSMGASGGILIMWDTRVVEKIDEARRLMWEELAGISSWWDSPWCIGGDFNATRFPSDKLGGQHFTPAMTAFSEFISSCELLDPPLEGGRFTWSNGREIEAMSRLDRFLFSHEWDEKFPTIKQQRLTRLLSDHFPVGGNHILFMVLPSYVLAQKLIALKGDLKKWNEECFGNVAVKSHQLLAELRVLENVAESRSLSSNERIQQERLVAEWERNSLLEEISWRQKSRELWLKEGDKNTKFFHRVANSHRRYNTISSLLVNGNLTTDQQVIADCITHFYTGLYSEESGWRPKLDNLAFSMISAEDAVWLERPFGEEEVVGVLKAFNGDKAPGSDGFPMAFFQACWDVVQNEVMESINYFHEPARFFASSRGLRQGDPLSPLLFVIVMETLSRLMDRATIGGYISGFAIGSGVDPLVVSHLLFADDNLIFCIADQVQIAHLRAVFSWFEAVSGLKVNLAKSEMVPVGVVSNLRSLVELMGCNILSLPMTYLGLPLGANFNSKTIWNTVIEKMEKRAWWVEAFMSF
uniref:Reverse transcriptase domain-containing protein n=1 Tax=Fagus sylvatica TaxID=28930 RepID=A0A2N9FPT0_FAGSY